MVDFVNTDSTEKKAEECLIGEISIAYYDLENEKLEVISPGNIQMGAPKEEVIKKYGTAGEEYKGEVLHVYTWYADKHPDSHFEADFDPQSEELVQVYLKNSGD